MADWQKAIPIVQRSEGGLSKDPVDTASKDPVPDGSGYHTNKGVTWTTFKALAATLGYLATPALFYQMPALIWGKIMKKYWDQVGGDQLVSDSVAILLTDWAFGSGKYAVQNLQQVLNRAPFSKGLSEDGAIGPKTISAANSVDQAKLLDLLQAERIDYYNQLVRNNPSQQRFYNGWIDDAKYTYDKAKAFIVANPKTAGAGAAFFLSQPQQPSTELSNTVKPEIKN